MGIKLRKTSAVVVLVGSAALLAAPPAEANRGSGTTTTTTTEPGYVPTYGGNPVPEVPDEPDPYGVPVDNPVVAPTVVPVDFPATDPAAGQAGEGDRLAPAPSDAPTVEGGSVTQPEAPATDGVFGGILSRTGAETLPLARAGLAALTLGVGLVILGRRRRSCSAS